MASLSKWSSQSALNESTPVWMKHHNTSANFTDNASSYTGSFFAKQNSHDSQVPNTTAAEQTYTINISQRHTMRHLRYSECRNEKYLKKPVSKDISEPPERTKLETTADRVDRELARRREMPNSNHEPFTIASGPDNAEQDNRYISTKPNSPNGSKAITQNPKTRHITSEVQSDGTCFHFAQACSHGNSAVDRWSSSDTESDNDQSSRNGIRDTRRMSEACASQRSHESTGSSCTEGKFDIERNSLNPRSNTKASSQTSDTGDRPDEVSIADQSELDQFHTAPSTPENNVIQYSHAEYKTERNTASEIIPTAVPEETKEILSGGVLQYSNENHGQRVDLEKTIHDSNVDRLNSNACAVDMNEPTSMSALDTFTEHFKRFANCTTMGNQHKTFNTGTNGQENLVTEVQPLVMAMPTFIPIEYLEYETDPHTGEFRTVGRGSFGQVYRARFADPSYHYLPIVVKEFDQEFTNQREIMEEAQKLFYLGDTGFVPVCYGLVSLGDPEKPTYGLVQEFVGTGITLEQILWDNWQLSREHWLSVAVQCCEGLARFHMKGILLNDIKSNNIILEFNDRSISIKYIDFGLATDMRGRKYKRTKSLEEFYYLAPEIRLAGHVTNVASDIFSLGYMLNQIHLFGKVNDMKFVAGLCMDLNPDARIPVRAAASLIQDYMES